MRKPPHNMCRTYTLADRSSFDFTRYMSMKKRFVTDLYAVYNDQMNFLFSKVESDQNLMIDQVR